MANAAKKKARNSKQRPGWPREKAEREKADAEHKKDDAYAAAMKAGGDALAAKKYDEAVKAYRYAGGISRTDAALRA